jgi:hypothetical protein
VATGLVPISARGDRKLCQDQRERSAAGAITIGWDARQAWRLIDRVSNDWDLADDGRSWGDCKGGIGAPPLPLGEAETEEETEADNVEPFPEHQPQVAAE